ncbi:MAG: N-glycosylase/DNA lyase [Sulfolobales archaeon]|nr:N-glycosylase/DNA lyase [Sulfolobales archaeon]MCG2893557.1 N-glycosylase/DNA lyase [Sulfolobales archaeon]MCG2910047.1 N-glycosylase/DNA lyase [Sulfolobales archaeon]
MLERLRKEVENLRLRALVLERVEEFKLNNNADEDVWFRELVLCVLTANSSFVSAYKVLGYVMEEFDKGTYRFEQVLKERGYRFYELKAKYLKNLVKYRGRIKSWIKPLADRSQALAREVLANEIYGIGMKEASHFLRNVGYFDLAIVDKHVMRFSINSGLVRPFKTLTRSRYLEIERKLKELAHQLGMSVGILDLFIWHIETGTVLK